MPGDIVTTSGARFYIGPAIDSTYDTLDEFRAISGWTEVSLIEDLGEDGDQSNSVTGTAIGDSRVRKAKGARDAGQKSITCFHDPNDAGQLAMETAEEASDRFAFKETLNDGPTGQSDTVRYFRGLVISQRQQKGTNDTIIRNIYNIDIDSAIFRDPATA